MKKILILILGIILFTACSWFDEEEIPETKLKDEKTFVYQVMYNYYFWDETIPDMINLDDYEDHIELLSDLRYREGDKLIDRWSYVEATETDDLFYNEGQYLGMGYQSHLSLEEEARIVSNVYADSPADNAGFLRGTRITKINGKTIREIEDSNQWDTIYGVDEEGVAVQMEVYNTRDGEGPFELTIVKGVVTMDTVPLVKTINVGDKKVGYILFNSFITPAISLLDSAFTQLKNEGTSELVLDLRYNGGGYLNIASDLGGYINTEQTSGKVFQKLIYESRAQTMERTEWFATKNNSLNLDRVFILTTTNTASASEAVINGLKPFIDVYTVGKTSHGKPVGMNGYPNSSLGITIWPITFKGVNALDEGDFFDGFIPNKEVEDSMEYKLGDINEPMLKEALYFIENGKFAPESGKLKRQSAYDISQPYRSGVKGHYNIY